MKHLFITLITVLFIGCNYTPHPYENNAPRQDLTKIVHTIKVESKNLENNRIRTQPCNSFHIGDGYLLTSAHCVIFPKIENIRMPFGFIPVVNNYKDYKYTIKDKEIKFIGSEDDVALLYSKDLIDTQSISFINFKYIKLYDKVIIVGNSYMRGVNIKGGIISKLFVDGIYKEFSKVGKSFIVSAPTNPGDSGSPVFIVDRWTNLAYIVGMSFGTLSQVDGYGFVYKSNYLKEVIQRLKENEDE